MVKGTLPVIEKAAAASVKGEKQISERIIRIADRSEYGEIRWLNMKMTK